MRPIVVGITGYKGSGKNTVGDIFQEEFGFRQYAFADPMKEACKIIFLWGDEEVYGEWKERIDPRWGISPRQALQLLGTEYGQHILSESCPLFRDKIGRNLWVKRFLLVVQKHPDISRWVVTDIRFPHEVALIREMGGTIIKICRPGIPQVDAHESERWYSQIAQDYSIHNGGSFKELRDQVRQIAGLMGL